MDRPLEDDDASSTITSVGPDGRPADRPALPRLAWFHGTLLSLLAGLWISIGEVDHLLGQVLDRDQERTWSLSALTGPGAVLDREESREGLAFLGSAERTGDLHDTVDRWVGAYATFDILLALVYLFLAVAWYLRLDLPNVARHRTVARAVALGLLVAGGLADLVENVLLTTDLTSPAIWWATSAKWLLLTAGVVTALVVSRRAARAALRHVPAGLYTHRYTLLVVLPLGLLGIARGPDLLEQILDIQRRWVSEQGDFWAAGLVMLLLGALALVVGRQRTHNLYRRVCPLWTAGSVDGRHPCDHGGSRADLARTCPTERHRRGLARQEPSLLLWAVGPVLLLAGGLVLWLGGASVAWGRTLLFALVPASIGGLSWLFRRLGTEPVRRSVVSLPRWRTTSRVGDTLVALLPVIAGLGALRAFTAVRELEGLDGFASWVYWAAGWGTLLLAFPLTALTLLVLDAMADVAERDPRPGPVTRAVVMLTPGLEATPHATARGRMRGVRDQPVAWGVLVVAVVGMVAVGSTPVWLAEHWGVIATFQLALGCLSALVAASVILVQRTEGPELFWRLGVPYAPVTALLLATCLAIAVVGRTSDVHQIRTYAGDEPATTWAARPDLPTLFAGWLDAGTELAADQTCAHQLGDSGLAARPLLLVAAEGGGIRAAYWTAASIDRIVGADTAAALAGDDDPEPVEESRARRVCRGAFLSSGASGGSVGLSVASLAAPDGDPAQTARERVVAITGSRALGAAADGLVLRDTIYAATGLGLPSQAEGDDDAAARPGDDNAWKDRATLIEEAWEDAIPQLREPWLQASRSQGWGWGPTGALVVNATATTNSCRALVSQVQLPGRGTDCSTRASQAAPGSIDLVKCTGQLATSTAALLTARFPYVTPSGVVTCADDPDAPLEDETALQVVDGGYGDNSGVGTLVDLAPGLMSLVRRHNSCVLRGDCTDEPDPTTLVVPLLVYLDNGTGSDLVEEPGGPALEALVPPLTLLGATSSLVSATSQLQRAADVLATDQLWDPGVDPDGTAATAVDAWRQRSVYVVLQSTRPGIAAPLGWVLSEQSMDEMDAALSSQRRLCRLDAGTLPELVGLLDPPDPTDPAAEGPAASADVTTVPEPDCPEGEVMTQAPPG